jgi:hypothetical protein
MQERAKNEASDMATQVANTAFVAAQKMQCKIRDDFLLVLVRGGPFLQNIFTDLPDSLNKKARNHSPH